MVWELFLGMILIVGIALTFVHSVEIYTKVIEWLQKINGSKCG